MSARSSDRLLVGSVALCGAMMVALGAGGVRPAGPGAPAAPSVVADTFVWSLPDGFPRPRVPDDNPMTPAKVDLGRRLFYDTRLSGNGTQSCASCHEQSLAFSDPRALAVGSTGEVHPRSSMSLANVAYSPVLTWANPTLKRLEEQALVPMFGETPVELGLSGLEEVLVRRLADDDRYPTWFADAFPDDAEPISVANVTRALASFQRTLISGRSPYDRYRRSGGEVSAEVLRGEELFFSEQLECFHCHGGLNFTSAEDYQGKGFAEFEFHNTGLYNLDERGGYPPPNVGLYEFTGDPADMGRFKPPTLRNIGVTAPYMHDGSVATLEEVLDHYGAAGRTLPAGHPHAGVGSGNPNKSMFVVGFELEPADRAAVIAFLHSLTDSTFLSDPAFSNPWADTLAAPGARR